MTIEQNETFIRSAYKETGKGIVMLAQRVRDQEKTISILLNNTALATDWDRLMQERVGLIALNGELRAQVEAALDRIPAVVSDNTKYTSELLTEILVAQSGKVELHDICVKQVSPGIAVAVDVRGMPQVLAEFARLRETVNGQRHTIRGLQADVADGLQTLAKVRDANVHLQDVIANHCKETGRLRQLLAEREKADTFKPTPARRKPRAVAQRTAKKK